METFKRTPLELFHLPQHFVVPLFQRSYVWEEEEQWEPLWQDIRRTVELRLDQPHLQPKHFLGAVVIQSQEGASGVLTAWNVIDGQQRLTTLQLLMDATGAVLEGAGEDRLASRLRRLTHNSDDFLRHGANPLKVRHSNKDHAAYDEVMLAEPPIEHDGLVHVGSRIVRAHAYFTSAVQRWLGDEADPGYGDRAETLVDVLQGDLQLVSIELTAVENSQEIFETLNARGTPLTAADLIRNYVFQRLEAEGADTRKAYSEDWPFETKFWEAQVSVGRYSVGRSSLFLNQWLVSRVGEEISPQSTFTRFKSFVEHDADQKMADLLTTIKAQAGLYEDWTRAAQDPSRQLTATEMAFYRMRANGLELLKPILIWLHEPGRTLSRATIDGVVGATESWVVRRLLLRLTGSDLGRVVADVVNVNRDAPESELVDRVTGHLTDLKVSSTYWPGDAEVRAALATEPVYRKYRRSRLRMVLEAIEDHYRAETNQSQVERKGYPIEHVLPQKWSEHWPVEGLEAEQERADHVHRLGNLTLLTDRLNPKVSNASWPTKRTAFLEHNTINLTGRLVLSAEETWDEDAIDRRTEELTDVVLRIWSVPSGHAGEVRDPQEKTPAWIQVKHLLAAGLITPGTELVPRPASDAHRRAVVTADGKVEVDDGRRFDSPSGASDHVRGKVTNGWIYWRTPDGRPLADLRTALTEGAAGPSTRPFDWSTLHAILEALPEGRWTTYASLADAVGTAAQPLGSHVSTCRQCVNAHRVLRFDGSVAKRFTWSDPDEDRDPEDLLRLEGVSFTEGRADPTKQLSSEELAALIEE